MKKLETLQCNARLSLDCLGPQTCKSPSFPPLNFPPSFATLQIGHSQFQIHNLHSAQFTVCNSQSAIHSLQFIKRNSNTIAHSPLNWPQCLMGPQTVCGSQFAAHSLPHTVCGRAFIAHSLRRPNIRRTQSALHTVCRKQLGLSRAVSYRAGIKPEHQTHQKRPLTLLHFIHLHQ